LGPVGLDESGEKKEARGKKTRDHEPDRDVLEKSKDRT